MNPAIRPIGTAAAPNDYSPARRIGDFDSPCEGPLPVAPALEALEREVETVRVLARSLCNAVEPVLGPNDPDRVAGTITVPVSSPLLLQVRGIGDMLNATLARLGL